MSIDTTAPTITAATDRPPNSAGWYNASVTVTFTCADDRSGIADCPPPVVVSAEGADLVTGTVRDLAGNSASTSTTVSVDTIAPTITATPDRPPDGGGVYTAPVTVTFTCTDSGSGIAECPAPVVVATEGADQLVTGTAVDVAGNSASASVTVSVSFGSTEPLTITATASPAPNAAGWNNTAVTVTFTCTGSRLAVCPAPVVVSTDGAGQQVTGTATDTAGNTATATVTVSIDTTAPTITATVTPAPNAAGWNNTAVTVTFTCSDPVSGVVSCPSSVGVSTNGANRVDHAAGIRPGRQLGFRLGDRQCRPDRTDHRLGHGDAGVDRHRSDDHRHGAVLRRRVGCDRRRGVHRR